MNTPGRRWLELRAPLPPDPDVAALLTDGFLSLGARGVEERDGVLICYVEEPPDPEGFITQARSTLANLSGTENVLLETRWQEHEDWAESWKRGLDTRRITPRGVVTPSWIPVEPQPGEVVLVIDPGMAFGTAEHGTTRGCLRLIDSALQEGDQVLDVGAGSGILSIAAARLGAAQVIAVEGDPLACEALRENLEENGVADVVRLEERWVTPDELQEYHPVDGVVSNIETGILTPLIPGFHDALVPGGWLILSGILDAELPGILEEAEGLGFVVGGVDADEEWRSVWLVRPGEDSA